MKIRKTDRERVLLSLHTTKSNIQNSANYYFAEAFENRETVPFSAERNTHMDGLRTDCKKTQKTPCRSVLPHPKKVRTSPPSLSPQP
jgi:hypothetical protein